MTKKLPAIERARVEANLSLIIASAAAAYFLWLDGGGYKWLPGESGLTEFALSHLIGALIVLAGIACGLVSMQASPSYRGISALFLNVAIAVCVFLFIQIA